MHYQPAVAAKIIGIGPSTLRVWSHQFAELLSPGARPGTTARRYTDQDLGLFRQAKVLLDRGLTFDQAGAQLQRELGGLATSLHFIGDAQRIADLETQIEALQLVISAKDETIAALQAHLARLTHEVLPLGDHLSKMAHELELLQLQLQARRPRRR